MAYLGTLSTSGWLFSSQIKRVFYRFSVVLPFDQPVMARLAKLRTKLRALIPGKKTAKRLGIGFLVLLVFFVGAAEYTSRPSFCTTCHYMEPFHESWQASSHREVTCVKCHFPPGVAGTVRGKMAGLVQVANYLTRSYTRRKPWAEIEDASCLQSGCHETRLLEDSVRFRSVNFAHKPHLEKLRRGKELRCTSCHSQIVQGDHIVVTETSCFLCHFKKSETIDPASYQTLSDCQTCHQGVPAAVEPEALPRFDHTEVHRRGLECTRCHNQTIVGDGFVPTDTCFGCHFEPAHLSRYDSTEFLHNKHITENKIECTQCHLRIQHKIQRLTTENELECTNCHSSAHKEQLMLFTGADGVGTEAVTNPMFAAGLDCASCHVFHEQLNGAGTVRKASAQACEGCHGEGYARLLGLWEQAADNKLRAFRSAVNRVENSLRNVDSGTREAVRPLVEQAKNGMHVVEVGKAVHNIAFADRIIQTGYERLREALTQANVNLTLPAYEAAPNVPGECANCHTGIETITTSFEGASFSHQTHVVNRQLECSTCHSNAREHGELTASAKSCNTCHHQPPAVDNCASCHQTASAIYAGTFLDRDSPDLMFDEEVACVDCHVADRQIVRPDAQICVDCHDDDYAAMGAEWKTDVLALLEEVNGLLRRVEGVPALRSTAAYRDARDRVRTLERGSANGLHNYDLTLDLLDETKKQLQALVAPPSP